MNSFSKFKNYLKGKRKDVQSVMADCQKELAKINADIDNYKDERNVVIRLLSFLMPQKFEDKKKTNLWQERDDLKVKLNDLNAEIVKIQNVFNSFDNEKAVYCLTSPSSVFKLVTESYKNGRITMSDISKIMGSFLYFIEVNVGEPKLSCFYNQYGDFVKNDGDIRSAWNFYLATFFLDRDYGYIIEDIGALYDEFKTNYKEEVNVVSTEKVDTLNTMRIVMEHVIFLNNIHGISYFEEDLEKIDKGLRKQTMQMLGKIKPEYRKKFRRVFNNRDYDIPFYELPNFDTHVIFAPIEGDFYLVLGAAFKGKNYDKITNRYFKAKALGQIDSIKEMLRGKKDISLIDDSPCLTRHLKKNK